MPAWQQAEVRVMARWDRNGGPRADERWLYGARWRIVPVAAAMFVLLAWLLRQPLLAGPGDDEFSYAASRVAATLLVAIFMVVSTWVRVGWYEMWQATRDPAEQVRRRRRLIADEETWRR